MSNEMMNVNDSKGVDLTAAGALEARLRPAAPKVAGS
jgi:hypothetical protein